MDKSFYEKAGRDQLIQELMDRDAVAEKQTKKIKNKKSRRMIITIIAILVVIGATSGGVGHYVNKDVIKIRSTEDTATVVAEAPPTIKPTVKPEIDPLSSLMIFDSNLADSSSVKIICQAHSIPGADVYRPLAEWAKQNGYHAIMFGNILSFNDRIVLTGPKNLDIEAVCNRLQSLGIHRAISLAVNSQNLEMPYPFEFTSQGHITYEMENVKKAFVWPTGKQKKRFVSSNMTVEMTDGKARVYVDGKPFVGVPEHSPIKKMQ